MRRSVSRKVLLRKQAPKRITRASVPSKGARSSSFYQEIASRGGSGRYCVVRRVGGIGDVLMITPALRQLKRDFPNMVLVFALDLHSTGNNVYHELVKNAPFVDEIVDARYVDKSKYAAVIDVSSVCLRYEREDLPAVNRIDLFARAIGVRGMANRCSWYQVEPDEAEWAARQAAPHRAAGKKIVVLHTASMEEKRCWPVGKYLDLIKKAEVDELPVQFWILDFNRKYDSWRQRYNCDNWSGTNLRQMAALIAEADVFIGPDSGPMHLAGAVETSSIVLFGSIPPEARINHYPTHEAVTMPGLSCLGCWYKRCPYDIKCMKQLEVAIVYRKLKEKFQ